MICTIYYYQVYQYPFIHLKRGRGIFLVGCRSLLKGVVGDSSTYDLNSENAMSRDVMITQTPGI